MSSSAKTFQEFDRGALKEFLSSNTRDQQRNNMGRRNGHHQHRKPDYHRHRSDQTHQNQSRDGCVVVERQFNADRVPSVEQVKAFFRKLTWGSYWWCVFALMFFAGLRPCEVKRLHTDNILRSTEHGGWTGLNYKVGKPKPPGRPKKGEKPKKAVFKKNQIRVDRDDLPQFLLDGLMHYWVHHRQKHGVMFPNMYSQYRKKFSVLRKEMVADGHENWGKYADPDKDPRKGWMRKAGNKVHAITPYSGRRFFVTFYYWIISPNLSATFTPDRSITQRRVCHSGKNTTQIYIYPFPDLGLRRDHYKRGWDVLVGEDVEQSRLTAYL